MIHNHAFLIGVFKYVLCSIIFGMIMMIPNSHFSGKRETGKPPSSYQAAIKIINHLNEAIHISKDLHHGIQPRIKQAYDLPPKSQGHFREVTTTNRPSAMACSDLRSKKC